MSRVPVPTPRELEVLRYLGVGMHIDAPEKGHLTYFVRAKGVTVIRIQRRTIAQLREAGWIDENLMLTAAGRAVADCKTFVRAFADSLSQSPTPENA
jgi:hypothetical protein